MYICIYDSGQPTNKAAVDWLLMGAEEGYRGHYYNGTKHGRGQRIGHGVVGTKMSSYARATRCTRSLQAILGLDQHASRPLVPMIVSNI